jgi:c-di-GMP-binding flagellar brake protein YcgR
MASNISNYANLTDRREGPRKIFQRRAVLTFGELPPLHGRTLDISPGGVAVMLECSVPEGQECQIAIHAFFDTEPTHITANCKVVQTILVGLKGFRLSLQFKNINSQTTALINKILNGKQ